MEGTPVQSEGTPQPVDSQASTAKGSATVSLSWKDRFTQAKSTMFSMTGSLVSPLSAPSRPAVQPQARLTSEGRSGAQAVSNSESSNGPIVRVMLLVQERPSHGGSNSIKRDFLTAQKEQFEQQFQGEKRVWTEQLSEARKEMAELRDELEDLKTDNARIQEKCSQEEKRAEAQAVQIQDMRDTHKALVTLFEEVEEEADEYVTDIEELEQKYHKQTIEFEELKEMMDLERVAWQDERRAAATEVSALRTNVQAKGSSITKPVQTSIETGEQINDDLQEDDSHLRAQLNQVKSELNSERRRANGLDLEVKQLREKLRVLGEEASPVKGKVAVPRGSRIRSMQEIIQAKKW
uniref:Uncharacterized protein n=1 Tax=Pyramimonas obovata TaxID=1411642 RepID=A0A6T7X0K3_9CHLO|mmetsp:Transcript_32414/g.70774  ORF Transcript_32414/g.70774 Transcript_32414/m.70774 type:complete len:350 (+) Transcript_32414:218-1267(+)|eukprot:CAMPEP_0118924810 /NCGR_PEP_ID=MMETSP1169-20130426/2771_1 /TAXON_ID=36882 /ORGANISM="Pyramimonas obovata, Strain CCMP722" /LENGTH=349 /DNA_ID=CAMNT_0006865943 /DNA_START=147 /DNA_END=1196 /DNA_ORIENTATION=-